MSSGQRINEIDLNKALTKSEPIVCSDLILGFDYIVLETNEDIQIDANPKIFVHNQLLFVTTIRNCYLFDRSTGKFIREIGRNGKGPTEYRSTQGLINPDTEKIYLTGWNSDLLEYDYNGQFIKSIKIPGYLDNFQTPSIPTQFTHLNENIVCYFSNIIGPEEKLILVFNTDGEIIRTYPNSNIFPESVFQLTTKESCFYHFGNRLYFKENYNDTVFEVAEFGLTPKIVLYTGKYRKPYEAKWSNSNEQGLEFITPFDIMETDLFILFKFYFKGKLNLGFYDKSDMELKINELEAGIKNDINNFIPFMPTTISNNGELAGIMDAFLIQQWFTDNPDKTKNLPLQLQQLKEINESDNPVVIIAKIKAGSTTQ